MVCDPIFKLLRKHQPIVSDEQCQKAFDRIKEYLIKLPVLKPPKDGKPLILYLALEEEAIGELVAQGRPNDMEHKSIITVISKMDSLNYLFKVPFVTEKLARWLVLLIKFNIEYATKKVVKGRAVADFLSQNAIERDNPWDLEFLDKNLGAIEIQEWKMYFDGAVNARGVGLGVILITLEGEMLPMAKRLDFKVTNNIAEYKACLFGLEAAMVAKAK
eukprot:XP_015575239.1 uncharacterized protein LOC107261313 [Ricinus communis]